MDIRGDDDDDPTPTTASSSAAASRSRRRRTSMMSSSSSSSSSSTKTTTAVPAPTPPPPPSPQEASTLLLMLLAQVCSLHDATPRTFVVHVIALYERGVLDRDSIRFLYELGLVPRPLTISSSSSSSSSVGGDDYDDPRRRRGTTTMVSYYHRDAEIDERLRRRRACRSRPRDDGATESVPSESFMSSSSFSSSSSSVVDDDLCRRREASAIREHLERHESHEEEGSSSISAYDRTVDATTKTTTTSGVVVVASTTTTPLPPSASSLPESSEIDSSTTMEARVDDVLALASRPPPSTATGSSWSVERHPLSLSRYRREFRQISLLASGSFGSVYHALHKLERRSYAVKRVIFSTTGYYEDAIALVTREVRILACLDHPNCVRYYASWLEPSWMTGDDNDDEGGKTAADQARAVFEGPKLLKDVERGADVDGLLDDAEEDEIDESTEYRRLEAIPYYGRGDEDDGFHWTTTTSSCSYHPPPKDGRAERRDANDDDCWDYLPSHRTNGHHPIVHPRGESVDGSDSEASEWTQDYIGSESNCERDSFHNSKAYVRRESLEFVSADGNDVPPRRKYGKPPASDLATTYKYQISLYIQMQLCNPRTLADYINHRNESCIDFNDEERRERARLAIEIFGQIVSGLAHVHAKGIIHRDLKPANIFAGDDGTFMIGDFGLSKMILDANDHGVDIDSHANAIIVPGGYSNGNHTAGVGTASYASPEQTTSKVYGPAADIFSLGLILLELFCNFTSEHERAKAFHDCRHGRELSPWMKREHPEVSALILACTQTDWTRRPSASDIQDAGLFHERVNGAENFWAELRTLRMEAARKDRLIESQSEQMREKDDIIEDLMRRLARLESGSGAYREKCPKDLTNFPDSGSDGSSGNDC